MRSDTAFFSAGVMGRRFRSGLAPDVLSPAAAAAGFLVEEDRREAEARRRRRRSENLLDVGQGLDLGLEAVDLALAVGNGLCDDTHEGGRVVVL